MIILQKAAEILVECGYADYKTDNNNYIYWREPEIDNTMEAVKPFSDTLEGRRQADAIEDWLTINHYKLYQKSELEAESPKQPYSEFGAFWYQHRLDRIKWCLENI